MLTCFCPLSPALFQYSGTSMIYIAYMFGGWVGGHAERHAALPIEGEFGRALGALEGLREEVAAIASATERSLSAEPPALALLEWWASHTDVCHAAYRGFLHADAGTLCLCHWSLCPASQNPHTPSVVMRVSHCCAAF